MKVVWLTEDTRWVVWLLFPVFIAVIRCLLSFPFVAPFWYPDFVDYCQSHQLLNKSCSVYLRNGLTEGANHKNRLAKAPSFAKEVHECIKKQCLSTYSAFDPYGHHDNLQERYDAFFGLVD